MKTRSLLILGAGLGALAALPGHSQTSSDAALEAQCRATEATMPDSCPCTITKARAAGVNDTELQSLFKDDGQSEPVDQGKYGLFWQVKSQCMADSMMASLGVSQGNPLPGIPAHMRPQMPGAMPAVPSPAPQAAPAAPAMSPAPAPAPAAPTGSGASIQSASTQPDDMCGKHGFSGSDDIVICRDVGFLPTQLAYHQSLDQYPELLSVLKGKAQDIFDELAQYATTRERYVYIVSFNAPSVHGRLMSVNGADGDTSRGRITGASKTLWDTELGREVEWTDIFEASEWNGSVRREYCDRLYEVRRQEANKGNHTTNNCPELSRLSPVLARTDDGQTAIDFWGATGVVAGYANSAFYDGLRVPLDATLLRGVKAPYREALGANAAIAATPAAAPSTSSMQARLSPIKGVLYGEIQSNDDFYLLPPGRLPLETVAKFDRVLNQYKPILFMTLYDGGDGSAGRSLILDGRQHNLKQIGHSADYKTQTYSDGNVTVRIEMGKTVSNNPAFGYRVDTITITKGNDSETFQAINFGGA
ncbi:MAG: hypothetical protein AAF559_10175 [Pseudomonadota bacterium]